MECSRYFKDRFAYFIVCQLEAPEFRPLGIFKDVARDLHYYGRDVFGCTYLFKKQTINQIELSRTFFYQMDDTQACGQNWNGICKQHPTCYNSRARNVERRCGVTVVRHMFTYELSYFLFSLLFLFFCFVLAEVLSSSSHVTSAA